MVTPNDNTSDLVEYLLEKHSLAIHLTGTAAFALHDVVVGGVQVSAHAKVSRDIFHP